MPVLPDEASRVAAEFGLLDPADGTAGPFVNGLRGEEAATADPGLRDFADSSSRQVGNGSHGGEQNVAAEIRVVAAYSESEGAMQMSWKKQLLREHFMETNLCDSSGCGQ